MLKIFLLGTLKIAIFQFTLQLEKETYDISISSIYKKILNTNENSKLLDINFLLLTTSQNN